MKWEFRNNKDFWAGLMFLAIGVLAMVMSWSYRPGTALRMGPGYYPRLLSGILILFGLYIMLKGLRMNAKIKGHWSLRAIILISVASILFGILMEWAGFLPALAVLILVSAAAGREFKLGEAVLLTLFLMLFSTAVFIWGIGLPYHLVTFF